MAGSLRSFLDWDSKQNDSHANGSIAESRNCAMSQSETQLDFFYLPTKQKGPTSCTLLALSIFRLVNWRASILVSSALFRYLLAN